jgi:hypothetical protein
VDTFRPERWLSEDAEERLALMRGLLGFGAGNRICLGRHLAELEMKKVLPSLLLRFDVSEVFPYPEAGIEANVLCLQLSFADPRTTLESMDGLTAFPKPIIVKFKERYAEGKTLT